MLDPDARPVPPSRRWVFVSWLALFYTTWSLLVVGLGLWDTVASHWPIAVSMAFGSYFAGSTPMGGGAVGFPVLVLLFDQPASMGRNFGFAVQSIGMVSASIYILASRTRVDWQVLRVALPVAAVCTPAAGVWLAPEVPSQAATLVYSVIVASFGIIHILRMEDVLSCARLESSGRAAVGLGLGAGILGGAVASVTGVGIDMLVYIGLVAYARVDLRVAIPTSVILMAFTSVVGIASNAALGTVEPAVFEHWIAAAPVVALGAPLGALVVGMVSRIKTLFVTSVLCVAQLVWAVIQQGLTGWPLLATLGALALLSGLFLLVFAVGARAARFAAQQRPRAPRP